MGDMARRYPQVRYWELWNEMDNGFTDLCGAGRASGSMRERGKLYAKTLQSVYLQIRKANRGRLGSDRRNDGLERVSPGDAAQMNCLGPMLK